MPTSVPAATRLGQPTPSGADGVIGVLVAVLGGCAKVFLVFAGVILVLLPICMLVFFAYYGAKELLHDTKAEAFFAFIGLLVGPPIAAAVFESRRHLRTLEIDAQGLYLRRFNGSVRLVQFVSIRGIQSYLDEVEGLGTQRGIVLTVENEKPITLQLGEHTESILEAICHKTQLVPRHSWCRWQEAVT
jgi:hypothetical protein